MPEFEDQARSEASPEEVWKLLYDPGRFPEWWVGVETVERGTGTSAAAETGYTMFPAGYPDFPILAAAQALGAFWVS